MWSNTKLLTIISLLIIFAGFSLLWFGFQPKDEPVVQNNTNVNPKESTSSVVVSPIQKRVKVTKVIDGDTIEIEDGTRVRYIGIDTPETKDPRRPVGCFGKEASAKNKELVEGKEVILEKDVSDMDKYNRLLRYVYLPINDKELLFVQDYLVREGYATVLTYPPDVKYNEQFLGSQRYAKENKKGLWGRC